MPPIHNGLAPVTEPMLAFGFIVTDCCAETVPPQPPVIVKIILQVPAVTPVTNPDRRDEIRLVFLDFDDVEITAQLLAQGAFGWLAIGEGVSIKEIVGCEPMSFR